METNLVFMENKDVIHEQDYIVNSGMPTPQVGDEVRIDGYHYKVKCRIFTYGSAAIQDLQIIFNCKKINL